MKTKIILATILAATVALSGSVFAAPGDVSRPGVMGSGGRAPSGDNKAAALLVKLCGPGKRNDSKGLQDFIKNELSPQLQLSSNDKNALKNVGNRPNADRICGILKEHLSKD